MLKLGLIALLGVCLALARGAPLRAETGIIAGDSLGVGVGMASHLPYLAKNSVSIRSGAVIAQIRDAKPGTTLFLSLGTNDAVGSIVGLNGGIDHIVEAAKDAKVRLVWIGPPCVFKPWDKNAIELDAILKKDMADAGITYVSMRDDTLCNRSVRGPDGVHFNMRGYYHMWDLARSAAGFVVEASATPVVHEKTPGSPTRKTRKKRLRKTHIAHHPKSDAAPAADTTPAEPAAPPQ